MPVQKAKIHKYLCSCGQGRSLIISSTIKTALYYLYTVTRPAITYLLTLSQCLKFLHPLTLIATIATVIINIKNIPTDCGYL